MALYFSGEGHDRDGGTEGSREIIENRPEYASFDDEGRLVLDLDEMHEDKIPTLLDVVKSAVETSEEHILVEETEWGVDLGWW